MASLDLHFYKAESPCPGLMEHGFHVTMAPATVLLSCPQSLLQSSDLFCKFVPPTGTCGQLTLWLLLCSMDDSSHISSQLCHRNISSFPLLTEKQTNLHIVLKAIYLPLVSSYHVLRVGLLHLCLHTRPKKLLSAVSFFFWRQTMSHWRQSLLDVNQLKICSSFMAFQWEYHLHSKLHS